ncbi:C25 family cysteine peptidase [Larkinella sp. VNQ87]|uniref:putative type IX secretion system sortase PorU2 n=1 Tax=Larkinella sp. VNQ87 TaxID=3400921 RepID=UPI003BFC96CA
MRKQVLVLLLLISSFCTKAQNIRFGNEWITYDQTYYRIPVTERAVYRLTTSDLQKAGVPVSSIDPTTLQLFRRGIEQAIWVAGEQDKKLDAPDYLEFVGEGNDGLQDTLLYRPMSAQPHPYYSMYSDTAAYFLTWRTDGKPGKRVALVQETNTAGLQPETYHLAEHLLVLKDEMSTNPSTGPTPFVTQYEVFFEAGEGWTGPMQPKNKPFTQTLKLPGWFRRAPEKPELDVLLNGRDNFSHEVDLLVGPGNRLLNTLRFNTFQTARFATTLEASDLTTTGEGQAAELALTTLSHGPSEFDRYSVSTVRVRFPQTISVKNGPQQLLRLLPRTGGRSLLEIPNAPTSTVIYDITDAGAARRLSGTWEGTLLRLVVPNTATGRRLWVSTDVVTPARLERVVFRKFDPARANYLIVSHETLMKPTGQVADPVRAFAAYRASAAGGRYDTLVVTMKALFNQFSFGERTPLAIRRFADYMLTGGSDKFLFLLGRSSVYFPFRKNANQYYLDLVPTVGQVPGSDVLLTAGLAGFPENVPALPTGRLNVLNPFEVGNYLTKVQEFESSAANVPWRKEILHLTGGRSEFEQTAFRSILDEAKGLVQRQYLGSAVTTQSKKTDEPVERIDISRAVNDGVSMISFFGHSSPTSTDLDIGYASDPVFGYRNKGRYPLMFFNGCGVGNIFYGGTVLSTNWVLSPDKGAIAVLAHCFSGYTGPLNTFTIQFYKTLFTDSTYFTKPIGIIHQETTRRVLATTQDGFQISNAHQMVLQGDPALRIFPLPKADFQIQSSGISRLDDAADSVRLRVVVINAGRYDQRERLNLTIRKRLADGQIRSYGTVMRPAVAYRDTIIYRFRPELDANGPTRYELVLDADNQVAELDETNNLLVFTIAPNADKFTVVLPDSSQRLPPDHLNPLLDVTFDGVRIPDGAVVSPNPTIQITVLDEDLYRIRQDTLGLDLLLRKPCESCRFERIALSSPDVNWTPAGPNNRFTLNYLPKNLADGVYTLRVQATDVSGNKAGVVPYEIRFRVRNEANLSAVLPTPNPFRTDTRFRFTISGKEAPGTGQLIIRNLNGQVVRTLRQALRLGENGLYWDGTDQGGITLPNGLYVFRLTLGDGRQFDGRVVLNR